MVRRRKRITGRDRMIVTPLGDYGCVSAGNIKTNFWKTTDKSRAHFRRIGMLKKHRLIENVRGDGGITIGYRLTRRGRKYSTFFLKEKSRPILRKSYKTDFSHDQTLIEISRSLKKSSVIRNFQTEGELKQQILSDVARKMNWESQPIIPDAVFVLNIPGHETTIALELELTMKVKRRYGKIFRNHLLSKNWGVVIYVVRDEALREKLMRNLNDLKARDIEVRMAKKINSIYFCLLEDFQSKGLATTLTNGKRETSLEKIAQSFSDDGAKSAS